MRRLLLAALAAAACALGPSEPNGSTVAQDGPGRRVLFVGNSLTYVNDLPLVVRALSRAALGDSALRVGMVAFPDYSLEDHWARGDAGRAIAGAAWDVVVLQQGPSALESSRVLLLDYVRRFAAAARAAHATPALYAVWPTSDRPQDFARSAESYRLAADSVQGLLFPVGEAWQAAWRRDASLPLYASDGLHPSAYGTYLAGLVITGRITGRSPLGMPTSVAIDGGGRLEIPAAIAATLQAAAADVLAVR
jgi:hypothetical protein